MLLASVDDIAEDTVLVVSILSVFAGALFLGTLNFPLAVVPSMSWTCFLVFGLMDRNSLGVAPRLAFTASLGSALLYLALVQLPNWTQLARK